MPGIYSYIPLHIIFPTQIRYIGHNLIQYTTNHGRRVSKPHQFTDLIGRRPYLKDGGTLFYLEMETSDERFFNRDNLARSVNNALEHGQMDLVLMKHKMPLDINYWRTHDPTLFKTCLKMDDNEYLSDADFSNENESNLRFHPTPNINDNGSLSNGNGNGNDGWGNVKGNDGWGNVKGNDRPGGW